MMKSIPLFFSASMAAAMLFAQSRLEPGVKPFISVDAPVIALEHVRVIDGTGSPAVADQTIVIDHGRIRAVGPAASTLAPADAKVLDLKDYTVIPGLIGMHEHMFYPSGGGIPIYSEHAFSHPRLYLASGVTMARTAGSLEGYTDLNLKKLIDEGRMPGPELDVTAPYLEGKGSFTPQMHELTGPDDARRLVDYWASEGATSFKAYMHITRAELGAAIQEAHKHGLKITGHLCAVGFREAAALGIDNLEHGLVVDTEFAPDKQPDVCPHDGETSIANLDLRSAPAEEMIRDLVSHHVAVTSTLAVFEAMSGPGRPPLEPRMLEVMSPEAAVSYLASKELGLKRAPLMLALLKKEMAFERDFVQAGGLLMAGADPTGNGGAIAGFADQRNIELLVQAGFTPAEAIKIYTMNAATFMGKANQIGSITEGKDADLVVIDGDPSTNIHDIEKVTTVFKDGVGYDSAKLIASVAHAVGLH
jgi:imidazolonepropionase-like amidohydrolase